MGKTAALLEKLTAFDSAASAAIRLRPHSRIARLLALGLAHSGDSAVWAVLLIAAWLIGGPSWRARVILTVIGLLAAEILVVIVKAAVRRPRPAGTEGMVYRRFDPYSFPSGHAARAAMLAIISGTVGPYPAFLTIMIWSPFMLVARIAIGIHYVFDVVVGVVLGTALTFAVIQAVKYFVSLL